MGIGTVPFYSIDRFKTLAPLSFRSGCVNGSRYGPLGVDLRGMYSLKNGFHLIFKMKFGELNLLFFCFVLLGKGDFLAEFFQSCVLILMLTNF